MYMLKMKQIHALFILMLMLFLSSCRTATVSPAWGLCGYEDPVNECEWMRKIIHKNRTKGMYIAEVVAEKYIYIQGEDSAYYEKTGELMYAYQITLELTGKYTYDEYDMKAYDCNGQYLNQGYGISFPIEYRDNKTQQDYRCIIIDSNIIYEQEYR